MNTDENRESSVAVCEDCGCVASQGKVGCLKIFEEILAREFSDYRYGKIHRLTVDTYSLQHPEAYMRSAKSFAAHLTGMCAALEFEDPSTINRIVQKWLSTNPLPAVVKPDHIPEHRGNLTITYVLAASDVDQHIERAREWARDVWNAWSEHLDLARRLITEASTEVDKKRIGSR